MVANAATRRWRRDDGRAKLEPRLINAGSRMLANLPDGAIMPTKRMQTPHLPMFSPLPQRSACPLGGGPYRAVGGTVLRMTSVISARQAVTDLTLR